MPFSGQLTLNATKKVGAHRVVQELEAIENGVGGVGTTGDPVFPDPEGPFGPDFSFPRNERNLQARAGFVSRAQLIHCRDTIRNFIHGHWWWPCC